MHETSIALALLEQVRRHVPAGGVLRRVKVRAGPLRAVVPEAMDWAWQAVSADTELAGSAIETQLLPWRLRCADCGRTWDSPAADEACPCGSTHVLPGGSDELTLMSLEVDVAAEGKA